MKKDMVRYPSKLLYFHNGNGLFKDLRKEAYRYGTSLISGTVPLPGTFLLDEIVRHGAAPVLPIWPKVVRERYYSKPVGLLKIEVRKFLVFFILRESNNNS
jgi:hypothetical protein